MASSVTTVTWRDGHAVTNTHIQAKNRENSRDKRDAPYRGRHCHASRMAHKTKTMQRANTKVLGNNKRLGGRRASIYQSIKFNRSVFRG